MDSPLYIKYNSGQKKNIKISGCGRNQRYKSKKSIENALWYKTHFIQYKAYNLTQNLVLCKSEDINNCVV